MNVMSKHSRNQYRFLEEASQENVFLGLECREIFNNTINIWHLLRAPCVPGMTISIYMQFQI